MEPAVLRAKAKGLKVSRQGALTAGGKVSLNMGNNKQVSFDELGERFAEEMTLGKFGAVARGEKLSLLNEMTQEQMSSYTPQQLRVLLLQREKVASIHPPALLVKLGSPLLIVPSTANTGPRDDTARAALR